MYNSNNLSTVSQSLKGSQNVTDDTKLIKIIFSFVEMHRHRSSYRRFQEF